MGRCLHAVAFAALTLLVAVGCQFEIADSPRPVVRPTNVNVTINPRQPAFVPWIPPPPVSPNCRPNQPNCPNCPRRDASGKPCDTCQSAGCHCAKGTCKCKPGDCPNGCPFAVRTVTAAELPAEFAALAEPQLDIPANARSKNYKGGSCYWASLETILRWQLDDPSWAEWWRANHSGGAGTGDLTSAADRAGLRYAYTNSGDVAFLEWACRTRRGAAITYFSNHAINIVHLDSEKALLLDNNRTGQYITVPRQEFISKWQNNYGGDAITVVYHPAPPTPVL